MKNKSLCSKSIGKQTNENLEVKEGAMVVSQSRDEEREIEYEHARAQATWPLSKDFFAEISSATWTIQ